MAHFDYSIPYLKDVLIGKIGTEFRARRNRRNTHWYKWCVCEYCLELFPTIKSEIGRGGRGRYCSTKCASLDNQLKGADNPLWEGGTRSPEKLNCRQTFQRAVRENKIQRQPCSVCAEPNAEGHHEDYSKPFEVIWLCRKHHAEHHARILHNKSLTGIWNK